MKTIIEGNPMNTLSNRFIIGPVISEQKIKMYRLTDDDVDEDDRQTVMTIYRNTLW